MNLNDAKALAENLMAQHGLFKYPMLSWSFEFDQSKRRFGLCYYPTRVISLSKPLTLANDESHVRNTILHEIAHALAGRGTNHGPKWRRVAISIGCDGERLYGSEVIRPKRRWVGACPNCSHQINSHRRGYLACKRCCNQFNNRQFTTAYLLKWGENQ